MNQWYIITEPT